MAKFSGTPPLPFRALRIDRVAQTVADHIDADGAQAEDRRREHPLPPVLLDHDGIVGARKKIAPGGRGKRDAESEVADRKSVV